MRTTMPTNAQDFKLVDDSFSSSKVICPPARARRSLNPEIPDYASNNRGSFLSPKRKRLTLRFAATPNPMDKLKGTARRVLDLLPQRTDAGLPTTTTRPTGEYNAVARDEPKDSERLLASPSPSGESELTACEKRASRDTACDCDCHHQHQQPSSSRRLTPARVNLLASLVWLAGALLIFLVFRRDSKGGMPANGTFGWCKSLALSLCGEGRGSVTDRALAVPSAGCGRWSK